MKDAQWPCWLALPLLLALAACAASRPPSAAADEPQLGSTRGSVVAVEMGEELLPLTYLADELSEEELAELRVLAPNVTFVSGLTRETALAHVAGANGIDAHLVTEEFLREAPELRWVQAWSAGVDRYLSIEGLANSDRIVFTNMKGMHGPVIAEHSIAMVLSLTRRLAAFRDAQREARWDRDAGNGMTTVTGKTMLVAGMGGIGSEIAKRAHGLGMRVTATVRTARPAPDYVDLLGTAEDLDALLPEADVVAIALPLTAETEGLFDAERIARMKPGAILVNVGRGKICDTDALYAALESGHLAGACLDVTDPEPLPADHPLWKREDTVITPHVSSRAELTVERRWELFAENARRFACGEPLLNVVDKAAGY